MRKLFVILLTLTFMISGCKDDGPSGPDPDDFDRQAILVNWADNIIIPAFSHFISTTEQLQNSAESFASEPDQQNLTDLRDDWADAYLAFQHVSMFEMGEAMNLRFRDNLNIYPTDTTEIQNNISEGNYNLELPSQNSSQGFPALDYLLYGLAQTDAELLTYYSSHENAENHRAYLVDLTQRIHSLASQVHNDWTSGFRDTFVNNSGNGANSSIDMMVNDYIYYYEKHLRAGKIGIPAGVFSGSTLSGHVEAYYSNDFSKALFNEALTASMHFFNGIHFEGNTNGISLDDYLDYLNTMKEGTDLTTLINNQFEEAQAEADSLNQNFAHQVETDNDKMLATYDELQRNVVHLKVDMLQALNINVDYVDADGD